jgi:hypothetical protein
MEIGRRGLLVGVASLSLPKLSWPLGATPPVEERPIPTHQGWHPLTRSLLDRAGRAGHQVDRFLVERAIHEVAKARPKHRPLIINWLETPTEAFEHLSRYGRDELLRMRAASFWRGTRPFAATDSERSFDLYNHARDVLRVDEHDLALMAPKLTAKCRVAEARYPPQAVWKTRTVAAQIGWLETSLPAATVDAICAIADLLSAGHTESSQAIYHQLMVFEAYENGLLATWETRDELVCVPVTAVA